MNNREKVLSILNDQSSDEVDEIFNLLSLSDDKYTNDGESFITDSEYDSLRVIAGKIDPTNQYFLGIGSSVRTDKIKLPYTMGSLDQVQFGEIGKWIKNKNLNDQRFIITDKMDGISALLVYGTDGTLQIALTRGDGYEGQDITRHVKQIPSVPKNVGRKVTVRVEIEISNINFDKIVSIYTRKGGDQYKNARNFMAGVLNTDSSPVGLFRYVDCFAYEIMPVTSHFYMAKTQQLTELKSLGFKTVGYKIFEDFELTDETLNGYIIERKKLLDYDIDGIVIDVDDSDVREKLSNSRKSDSINPAYSIKYKITDIENIYSATVDCVEWNVSKHGKAKPRIKLIPFNLQGVTISHTTGFNAKYIQENKIGKGAVVKMTRSGDVIPYILEVITPAVAEMPENIEDYEWNETDVDLVLKDKSSNSDVALKRLTSWATALDIPNLKEGSIKKIIEHGYNTPEKIVNMTSTQLKGIIGKNGEKIAKGIASKLNPIALETLLGSYPSFGVGVGVRKFKMLVKQLRNPAELLEGKITEKEISGTDGFDKKTASIILEGLNEFVEYYNDIKSKVTVITTDQTPSGQKFDGQKICFTGFRNKEWETFVESNGGEIVSGVSKKTTLVVANDTDAVSGKTTKAKDLGIDIVSRDDFQQIVGISKLNNFNDTLKDFFN